MSPNIPNLFLASLDFEKCGIHLIAFGFLETAVVDGHHDLSAAW